MGLALRELREHLAEVSDLSNALGVLSWDQQTCMPPGGGGHRAEQMATLRRLAHARFTGETTARLLDAAAAEVPASAEDSDDFCLIRITRRDLERQRCLPSEFVSAWARDGVLSNQAWREARTGNDFAAYRPHLEKMVDYVRQAADYYGYKDHPYDALLEGYEPGMKTADVRRIFSVLRPAQVEIARAVAPLEPPRSDFLHRTFPVSSQGEFGLRVAADFGYDLNRGRLDVAPHPFAASFGVGDVRITTRYAADFLPQALFAIFHEAGHGIYEQNVSPDLDRTPLGHGCSNVFHESQSRLWENVVARGEPFWRHRFPTLQAAFPGTLDDVTSQEFYRAVNRVQPSLIRVEADEVTYNLHIILRFELEQQLVEGALEVKDLPGAWATKMHEYLGVTPPDDRDGVMQDTHWSTGSIGYFPTYALGNVMGAQIYASALRSHPEIPQEIGRGEFGTLLGWLRDNVYRHGRKFMPADLALRVNGEPLAPEPYLDYLRRKFGDLYGIALGG